MLGPCMSFKNMIDKKFASNPVIAHRGAFKKNGFPENSIAALKEAIRLGCTGSEFDVRMTADDVLIVHHDPDYQQIEIENRNSSRFPRFLTQRYKLFSTMQHIIPFIF